MSYQQKEKKREDDNQLAKSVKDRCVVIYKYIRETSINQKPFFYSTKIAVEAQHGLISQVIKDVIFSMRPRTGQRLGSEKISEVTDMAIG